MSDDSKTARSDQDAPREAGDPVSRNGGGTPEQAKPSGGEAEAAPEEAAQAGSPAEAGESEGEQTLEKELEAVKAELAEHKDRYLRAAAEAENIRRRAENDVASARKFAIEGFASEILAVRDSLEIARSLEISEDDSSAVAKMKEGLDLTLKQLDSALSKFSVAAVEPQKGDKLDPERHQAMSTQETENVPPNHIVSVIQKGYTIHDRLLRPAMVVVARKPEGQPETAGEQA